MAERDIKMRRDGNPEEEGTDAGGPEGPKASSEPVALARGGDASAAPAPSDMTGATGSTTKIDEEEEPNVGFKELFHFCTDWKTKVLYTVGVCSAIIQGACLPMLAVFLGEVLDGSATTYAGINTASNSSTGNVTGSYNVNKSLTLYAGTAVNDTLGSFVALTVGLFVAGCLNSICFNVGAERQVFAFRQAYLRKVLLLDMRHYDELDVFGAPSMLSQSTQALKEGAGQQFGVFLQCSAQFITGYLVAILANWRFALVLSAGVPVLALTIGIFLAGTTKLSDEHLSHQVRAGKTLQQTLTKIKTIVSLNAQSRQCKKYLAFEEYARRAGVAMSVRSGWMIGCIFLAIYSFNGFCVWYGSYLIYRGVQNPQTGQPFSGQDVITVFWAILIGVFGLMGVGPWFTR